MSTAANSYYFQRRTIGRAASPPTWACYEEIPYDDDDDYTSSCSEEEEEEEDSCSEDDEEYRNRNSSLTESNSNSQQQQQQPPPQSDSEQSENGLKVNSITTTGSTGVGGNNAHDDDIDMDMGDDSAVKTSPATPAIEDTSAAEKEAQKKKDIKGKQRAVDPEPEPTRGRRHRKKERRQATYTLRPILTIHRSQGFVWNQDLFIPPYAKDRYVASTSPPNARGFLSSNSSNTDYEVEVVEIRVKEGELFH
ncbi:hypothetical protein NP233_g3392 [Leucocoprinus birnbaumii]|uniref:Uncharacterized protein n=1 Tax=Leucocoprinus birnbaumii TaxID=56174 RepID=A0AAD5VWK7_9AGAR|nr:hypothetical protein NP233_g3392 [Leucocoprinus birnbaumii]